MKDIEIGPIRPPSESESLLIRVTRGCHWNKCYFWLRLGMLLQAGCSQQGVWPSFPLGTGQYPGYRLFQ